MARAAYGGLLAYAEGPVSGRRRPVRRSRRRKNQHLEQVLLAAFAATVVLSLAAAALRWLAEHPWVVILAVLAAAGVGGAWMWHRREAARAVRDLMYRDGCADAQRVGGRGDNGADVKATDPYGRRWVIQCKHRKAGWSGKPVGTPDLHVLKGTGRQIHGGDVLVMLTNGRITSNAVDFAKDQRLHLVDRRVLADWAAGSRPLWELLRAIPPPRRQSPLS
ncbi:restriction endonuclease [Streptomyces virginiae]|uniref:restriction endonuclease n=1 Tax=Streptomyces virginiae TaxID=1961 RepID=UPI0036EA6366